MQADACWIKDLSVDDSLRVLSTLALDHCASGGQVGSTIAALINGRDWKSLVDFKIDLAAPWSVSQLLECRQALAYFQKLEFLEIGVDKEAQAFLKFLESEKSCKILNDVLHKYRVGTASLPPPVVLSFDRARRKIARILGSAPTIESLNLRFGPGATTSIRKIDANPTSKMAAGFQCSANMEASGRLAELLREMPHWCDAVASCWGYNDDDQCAYPIVDVEITPGRLEFVPKNAKTYRAIVVEPVLNGMLQAGIGRYMERKLHRAGIDIRDQSINKGRAREGSITNGLATIDLSSASDTISREVVKLLVPDDWYRLLSAARTSLVTYRGTEVALEKFSSMGNGFTFPLETLIFWALSNSVPGASASAYGDDIVCSSEAAPEVVKLLWYAGFYANMDKSFIDGPFRESCGGDYYLGIDVRPVYQKNLVSSRTLFTLHNYYWRRFDHARCDLVKRFIPRSLRLYGPDGYGDGHLLSDNWGWRKPSHVRRGWGGMCFDTLTLGVRRRTSAYPGDWVSPLYSIYAREGVEERDQQIRFTSTGRPMWTVPGHEGYKRTSIYTLA